VYSCRAADPAAAAAWDESLEIGLDALEDEAMRRSADGVPRPNSSKVFCFFFSKKMLLPPLPF